MMKLRYALLATAVFTCFFSQAEEQKLEVKRDGEKAQVFVRQNGQNQSFEVTKEELADKNKLADKLAALPAEQREKVVNMLSGEGLPQIPPIPAIAEVGTQKIIVKQLSKTSENGPHTLHVMAMTDGANVNFDLLKKLVQDSKLSKEQLLELQKLVDAKF